MENCDDTIKCGVCGSYNLRRVELTNILVYDCCEGCGHCEIDAQHRGILATFHEAQSRYYGEESILKETATDLFVQEVLHERIALLSKYLTVPSRVVEVGPGAGHVSRWLKHNLHDVTAVEHAPVLARQLSEMLSANVMTGEFETIDLPLEEFDAWCSFHVIEHVLDPLAHLSRGLSIVRPGGLAFLATPNARSWQQMWFESLSPNFDSAHLRVFSRSSLVRLCQRSGWEVVAVTTPDYTTGWVRVLTKVLRRLRREDEEHTAGKYARTSSPIVRLAGRLLQFLSFPLRALQSRLGYGNEIFLVLRKSEAA